MTLLTGRHEFKNGITDTIFECERLTPDAITLPQVLKQAGCTTVCKGKWPLGDDATTSPAVAALTMLGNYNPTVNLTKI